MLSMVSSVSRQEVLLISAWGMVKRVVATWPSLSKSRKMTSNCVLASYFRKRGFPSLSSGIHDRVRTEVMEKTVTGAVSVGRPASVLGASSLNMFWSWLEVEVICLDTIS